MPAIQSVYIVEPINQGWIIERLMRDVASELNARGVATRIGPSANYGGEEVIFNSRFLTALADDRAKVNSLFITHVDDRLKELQLKASLKHFSSFVCMSPQDADFMAGLNESRAGVVGIDLPARDLKVRPMRLALFSAHYEDGRKNEHWIAEYFRDKPAAVREGFIFCFMGWGWESFCATLGALEMNYEIYRYSRFTPGEYELYKEVLATMDALLYLGFDGGAMSVYDAINAGIDVIVPNISYHRGLGEAATLFDDREGFFQELDRRIRRHASGKAALLERSISAYADRLLDHWNAVAYGEPQEVGTRAIAAPGPIEAQALSLFRGRYKRLSASRVRSALIRSVQAILLK